MDLQNSSKNRKALKTERDSHSCIKSGIISSKNKKSKKTEEKKRKMNFRGGEPGRCTAGRAALPPALQLAVRFCIFRDEKRGFRPFIL